MLHQAAVVSRRCKVFIKGEWERKGGIGIKCAPLNAKSLTSSGDEGAPLVAVGILLNLNANQGEKREGEGGREGQEPRIEGKHPQNSAVAYATSRYVLVNTGVLDTAFTDFPISSLRSFSRRLSASRYLLSLIHI